MFKYFLVISFLFFSCLHSEAKTENPPETEKDTLKILSWNIHMLPYFYVFTKTKKRKRAKLIIEEFKNRDYNIILIQEAFHRKIRNRIKRKLKKKYPYAYGPPNKQYFRIQTNSGLLVLSDRPLIEKSSVQFTESYSWDNRMARKGAQLVQGEFNGHIFQIINTHTEGTPVIINNSQFHEIYDGLIQPYEQKNIPQIIAGDFNCNMKNEDQFSQMLNLLHVTDTIPHQDIRYNEKNKILKEGIDHIFIRKNMSKVNVTKYRKLLIGFDWIQGRKKIFKKTVGYSDHYPVDMHLVFPKQ